MAKSFLYARENFQAQSIVAGILDVELHARVLNR